MLLSIAGLLAILIALTVHEFAHAWMASYLGDPTAELAGRKTLNPLAHLDPLGTIMIFLAGFGWGKPVPIDPFNLASPRRDQALIALAGPLSNFITAAIFSLATRLFPEIIFLTLPIVTINLALGFFNLIPLYPLDGEKILLGFLPQELADSLAQTLSQYSLILILLLLLPLNNGTSLAEIFLLPLIKISSSIFLGTSFWFF